MFNTKDIESIKPEFIIGYSKILKKELRRIYSLKLECDESELSDKLFSKKLVWKIKNQYYDIHNTTLKKLKKIKKDSKVSTHPLNIILKQKEKHRIVGSSCDIDHCEETSSSPNCNSSTE